MFCVKTVCLFRFVYKCEKSLNTKTLKNDERLIVQMFFSVIKFLIEIFCWIKVSSKSRNFISLRWDISADKLIQ